MVTSSAGVEPGRAPFVADSGMSSEDKRAELARACGRYLMACRMASVAETNLDVTGKHRRYIYR